MNLSDHGWKVFFDFTAQRIQQGVAMKVIVHHQTYFPNGFRVCELTYFLLLFLAQLQGGKMRQYGDTVVVVYQVLQSLYASGLVVEPVAREIFFLEFA